jgi:hypothetical protein
VEVWNNDRFWGEVLSLQRVVWRRSLGYIVKDLFWVER